MDTFSVKSVFGFSWNVSIAFSSVFFVEFFLRQPNMKFTRIKIDWITLFNGDKKNPFEEREKKKLHNGTWELHSQTYQWSECDTFVWWMYMWTETENKAEKGNATHHQTMNQTTKAPNNETVFSCNFLRLIYSSLFLGWRRKWDELNTKWQCSFISPMWKLIYEMKRTRNGNEMFKEQFRTEKTCSPFEKSHLKWLPLYLATH